MGERRRALLAIFAVAVICKVGTLKPAHRVTGKHDTELHKALGNLEHT